MTCANGGLGEVERPLKVKGTFPKSNISFDHSHSPLIFKNHQKQWLASDVCGDLYATKTLQSFPGALAGNFPCLQGNVDFTVGHTRVPLHINDSWFILFQVSCWHLFIKGLVRTQVLQEGAALRRLFRRKSWQNIAYHHRPVKKPVLSAAWSVPITALFSPVTAYWVIIRWRAWYSPC